MFDSKSTELQSFEIIGGKEFGIRNVPRLRAKMIELGLNGFLVPHEDEWQNEYLPACNERLLEISGFSGSAGFAIIMDQTAHIFVDGRYTLQVRAQTDSAIFNYHSLVDEPPNVWIANNLKSGQRIGYDQRLFTKDGLIPFLDAAKSSGAQLIATEFNLIDLIWENRPPKPLAMAFAQKEEFSGENSSSKIAKIGEILETNGVDCFVFTAPMAIAWAYNIRGGDVSRTPLVLGSAIVNANGTSSLFIDKEKVTPDLIRHLGNGVEIHDETEFENAISQLKGKKVGIDPKTSSAFMFSLITANGGEISELTDPTILPRASKNQTEISNMQKAHEIDGVAMARFLAWFDKTAPDGGLDEITACRKLEEFRKLSPEIKDLSFDTISGAMGNAASPHYRVNEETNTKIELNSFFLIDSGGQYFCGTTDITRTISVGEISDEMKDRFTRVLKGHIALSHIKFPPNTPGCMLDTLARASLWDGGFDYDHGTGHGVGAFLSVHEGPQRIAKNLNNQVLLEGMVISNEPGFYKAGEFGIRIENLQYVTKAEIPPGGERPMHSFKTLTLAPIDKRAISFPLLTKAEIDWLNAYHARVYRTIGPHLNDEDRDWLKNACSAA